MDWLDAMQWPAMVVTIIAAWLVASHQERRRAWGFWVYIVSNVLWVAWGWSTGAWALVTLQVALFAMNLRGTSRNDAKSEPAK